MQEYVYYYGFCIKHIYIQIYDICSVSIIWFSFKPPSYRQNIFFTKAWRRSNFWHQGLALLAAFGHSIISETIKI